MRSLLLVLFYVLAVACSARREARPVTSPPADSVRAAVAAAPDSAEAKTPPSDGVPIQTRVLPNGLRVIVLPNPVVPLVTIELDVKNGAYTQTPEFEGLAHLYEHMFFKANKALPNQERWLERTRELGVVWNGTTSDERVNYFVTLGKKDFKEGLEFMRDAIRYPLFEAGELERERPVVLGEYDRNESDPSFYLEMSMDSLLWSPAYLSRKNTIGNRDVIATTTREKMVAIQERYYVPNNSALILAGDVEPEDAFRLAEEVFGDWPRGEDPFSTYPIPPVPRLTESKAVIVERPVNSVTVRLTWQGPSVARNAAATYAADLFATALGLPDTGFQKRIVDSGLAFGAGMGYTTLAYNGPIRIVAQTAPDKVKLLLRALDREIAAFDDPDYFTEEQLAAAKNLLKVADVYAREQPSEFAHTLGYWWAVADMQYYLSYIENVMNVDREDLVSFVRTYIKGKPRVTGVLLPPEERPKIGLTKEELL